MKEVLSMLDLFYAMKRLNKKIGGKKMDEIKVQDKFNDDNVRNLVEEGVIQNVQDTDECADDMERPVE